MHLLTSATLQPDLLAKKKPILLLDTSLLPIRSLIRYVAADAFAGGAAGKLPTEIWLNIIEHARPEKPQHVAVQPTAIVPWKYGSMLHCRAVDLDLGTFDDKAHVEAAERWLQSPHTYDQEQRESENGIIFRGAKDTKNNNNTTTYRIFFPGVLPASSSASVPAALSAPDCLFTAITVPDVISWLQDGRCWLCQGKRGICPGCTMGKAQKFDAHLVALRCGVPLACPLCMGLEFMFQDKPFLEKYFWDEPPPDEKAARDAQLRARWGELGYLRD
ncbi:MAG: hypothetical protein LQ341_003978 [Variospora aurantia]|nr:MAG: hypothetical protein LQ341_003978 [Variospora aurantia]